MVGQASEDGKESETSRLDTVSKLNNEANKFMGIY